MVNDQSIMRTCESVSGALLGVLECVFTCGATIRYLPTSMATINSFDSLNVDGAYSLICLGSAAVVGTAQTAGRFRYFCSVEMKP